MTRDRLARWVAGRAWQVVPKDEPRAAPTDGSVELVSTFCCQLDVSFPGGNGVSVPLAPGDVIRLHPGATVTPRTLR